MGDLQQPVEPIVEAHVDGSPRAEPYGPNTMTKDERSCLLYMESCAVDGGGLVESLRMNAEDFAAIEQFKERGLLDFNRIPARILGTGGKRSWTHVVTLKPAGWDLAHLCRKRRAEQRGPHATEALAILAERAAPTPDTPCPEVGE